MAIQDKFNRANVIYKITKDVDLNGETLTIPEGCTLDFQGGSFSNGTIASNDLNISYINSGILKNIIFEGDFATKGLIKLDWFIKEYPIDDNDYSIDNTDTIQFLFDSGIKNLVFPDKYIHITRTIKSSYAINIYVEHEGKVKNWKFHPHNDVYVSSCIFSKNIVTFFDYNIDISKDTSDVGTSSLYIGAINCFCKKPYTDLTEVRTPIINITNVTDVWGITIDANITAIRSYIAIESVNAWVFNYTGINIEAIGGYISFVRINGNIVGTSYGLYCKGNSHSSPNWFTDVIIKGDTQCSYGGVFDRVSPVTIYGNHQSSLVGHFQNGMFPEGYFKGNLIYLYGYIWDCGKVDSVSKLSTVKNEIINTGNVYDSFSTIRPKNYYQHLAYSRDNVENINPLEYFKGSIQNALYRCLQPRNSNNWFIYPLTYEIGDDENGYVTLLKNNINLINGDNLFNDNVLGSFSGRSRDYINDCYVLNATSKKIKINFTISNPDFNLTANTEAAFPTFLYWGFFENTSNIKINIENTDGLIYQYEGTGSYNSGLLHKVRIDSFSKAYVSIIIECNSANIVLPTLIIPLNRKADYNSVVYTDVTLPNFKAKERYGKQVFNINTKMLNIWDGNGWVDAMGNDINHNILGSSSSRPINAKSGFQYFDTNLNKPIWWTGSKWVDATGTEV